MSYLVKNYNRKKISFKRGKGSYLYSSNGTKYLDFVQGIAVNSLGHAHPKLVNVVNNQSKLLWHVSNAFIIPEGEMLAKKLAKKTFADLKPNKKGKILTSNFSFINLIKNDLDNNDYLMIKASNATGFNEIIKELKRLN